MTYKVINERITHIKKELKNKETKIGKNKTETYRININFKF